MSDEIIRQANYTEQHLRAMGFARYERVKQRVLARELPAAEAPKHMLADNGTTLVAVAGYFICYLPEDAEYPTLDAYRHWPVEPQIFHETYKPWDEPWQPTPVEQRLLAWGCQPYYKAAHVWAKQLEEDVYIQSIEHEQPVRVATGQILAIGVEGEPYSMGNQTFAARYTPAKSGLHKTLDRLIKFFRR